MKSEWEMYFKEDFTEEEARTRGLFKCNFCERCGMCITCGDCKEFGKCKKPK